MVEVVKADVDVDVNEIDVGIEVCNVDNAEEVVDEEIPERITSIHFVCKHFSRKLKRCSRRF